jgi:hypothetical protein
MTRHARLSLLRTTGFLAVFAAAPVAFAAGTVTFALTSPDNGDTVAPGAMITWTITASVSAGDNVGLAGFSIDLVQGGGNPATLNLPAAVTPAAMTGFAAPAGVGNPAGYGGSPSGPAGAQNRVQIGGIQNTFGVSLGAQGQDVNVDAAIGQGGGGQLVATGSFAAPSTQGAYTFSIQNAKANVLTAVSAPPAISPVTKATASISAASFTFTVGAIVDCDGDLDGDGDVDLADLGILLAAFGQNGAGDVDGDGDTDLSDLGVVLASFGEVCP